MEAHYSRDEILRQVRAMLGIQTDNSLSTQVQEQHIVAVNATAAKAAQECKWVNAQGRVTVTLEAEQNLLNYPENSGPGSINAIAVYDFERYYPLDPRIIPVHADHDQEQSSGGDLFKSVQGRPRYYEQGKQIKTWPFSDKQYPLRIDYMRPIQMPEGSSISIIDSILIIYGTASMLSTMMADPTMATYYAGMYSDRLRALMAWQSQGTTFAINTEADLAEDEAFNSDIVPKWDRRPTITPSGNS